MDAILAMIAVVDIIPCVCGIAHMAVDSFS